jgi:hypothetical protein
LVYLLNNRNLTGRQRGFQVLEKREETLKLQEKPLTPVEFKIDKPHIDPE